MPRIPETGVASAAEHAIRGDKEQVERTPDEALPTDGAAGTVAVLYRRRWLILALNFSIIVIYFIDRQTLSMLAPLLRSVFHMSNSAYGKIVASLQFGMMSGEFPVGWLIDRYGARLGLAAAVLWWSTATGSQVFARSGFQLGFSRFWMGSAEGGNYSGGMKTVSRLFGEKERTLAIGVFNSGSVIGTAVAPPMIVFLLERYGFHVAFLAPALLGFLWVPLWWLLQTREDRRKADAVASQVSIGRLLAQSSTWAVMLCRLFIGPVMQFYWYWTPSYLFNARHLSLAHIGLVGWIPFFLAVPGGLAGGWTAGWLRSRGVDIYNTRRITMWTSSLMCVASLAVPWMQTEASALTMISIAVVANNFLCANMFAAISDLFSGPLVGRVTGLTGIAGGLSGLLMPLLTGMLVDRYSYKPAFVLIAFMPLFGVAALFAIWPRYCLPSLGGLEFPPDDANGISLDESNGA
jgi:ACS family hexuronate transporter-like MFS transporter